MRRHYKIMKFSTKTNSNFNIKESFKFQNFKFLPSHSIYNFDTNYLLTVLFLWLDQILSF